MWRIAVAERQTVRGHDVNIWLRPFALAALLPLLGCVLATNQPPPVPSAPPPAPPVAKPQHPLPPLDAVWSFDIGDTACAALASAGATSLRLSVAANGTIVIAVAPGGDTAPYGHASRPPPRLKVAAEGETWRWRLRPAPARVLETRLAASKVALAQILLMLHGGQAVLSAEHTPDRILRLPPAGQSGAAWFACARDRVQRAVGDDDAS